MKASIKRRVRRAGQQWLKARHPLSRPILPEYWGLETVTEGPNAPNLPSAGLGLNGMPLTDIAEAFGTPVHVQNPERLARNCRALSDGDGSTRLVEPYYSYKTHPVPEILSQMHARGVGAEVISEYELWLARHLGVPGDRIIYNGPAKSDASIEMAIQCGVGLLNLNHAEEMDRIAAIARRLGATVNLGVRVVVPGGWSGQFGVDIASGDALETYRQALLRPEFEVIGLHSHRGVLFDTTQALSGYLDQLTHFLDRLHDEFGWHPQILDVGGSLPIRSVHGLSADETSRAVRWRVQPPLADPESRPSLADFAQCTHQRISGWAAERGRTMPRLVTEPGRAMTGDASFLLSSVVELRQDPDGLRYAVLDVGVSTAGILRTEHHQLFQLTQRPDASVHTYRLVGPICHMGDNLYPAIELAELQIGDVLAIMDSGAYFVPEASNFSFPRPGIVEVDTQGQPRWLRRAECFQDMVSLDNAEEAPRE